MEITENLRKLFEPVFQECNVQLYEMRWITERHEHTLEVSIMKPDGTMDLDTCAAVSEKLSEVLDQNDPVDGEYTLEVCSPGAEREIRDLNELDHMAGSYVYIRLKSPVKKMTELTGTILSCENDLITLEYRDKAVKRKAEFTKDNIDFIRLAVKI